uniref:Uncharacterized protein n=1 Tax=Rhizophora mucronata TaxID=61149 RepID=A0A2P2NDG7_RHIMU
MQSKALKICLVNFATISLNSSKTSLFK